MENNWQPIETAPKDGSHVLVCHWPSSGRWSLNKAWVNARGQWLIAKGVPLRYIPTHWMPLPKAPGYESVDEKLKEADYIYEVNNWDCTYPVDDCDTLIDDAGYCCGEIIEFGLLKLMEPIFYINLYHADEDEYKDHWFNTREEAEKFLKEHVSE